MAKSAVFLAMAGLVEAIHVLAHRRREKTWMPGSGPGMTGVGRHGRACPGHPRVPVPSRSRGVDARLGAGHDGVVVMAGLVPAIHVFT